MTITTAATAHISVRHGGEKTEPNIIVLGTDDQFLGNYSYELAYGRFFTSEDVHYARSLIILGAAMAVTDVMPMMMPSVVSTERIL